MNTTKKLEGVIPAIITPLQEDGNLDLSLLEKQWEKSNSKKKKLTDSSILLYKRNVVFSIAK